MILSTKYSPKVDIDKIKIDDIIFKLIPIIQPIKKKIILKKIFKLIKKLRANMYIEEKIIDKLTKVLLS